LLDNKQWDLIVLFVYLFTYWLAHCKL